MTRRPGRRSALLLGPAAALAITMTASGSTAQRAVLTGVVVDAESGKPVASRIYLRNAAGEWLFVTAADPAGSALPYREQWVPMAGSVEKHTTVSAHPFRIALEPGRYEIEIERGKEYLPLRRSVEIGTANREEQFRLTRWVNLARRGWYSGETHVHRRLQELPNVMAAEDLNVAFPVTFWTVRSDAAPGLEPSPLRRQGPSPFGPREDRGFAPIPVDRTHVILPRNTEYEIFSIGERRHTLGAVFVLNHRTPFRELAPPVAPISHRAHAEGALLDLDKHSWPWAAMLVPVADVDLFELSNNSVWRTRFGFNQLPPRLPPWARCEQDTPTTLTEWGWLNYGFEFYYGLLNCGFRLAPTAGTASGVHPVPLGHSRVYVHTGRKFELAAWLRGLQSGRSFVTTGPMLFVRVNGQHPGAELTLAGSRQAAATLEIESLSAERVERIEILQNGVVVEEIRPEAARTPEGAWKAVVRRRVPVERSGWLAVRSVEPQPDGRNRFAHTAPWHVTVRDRPAAPRRDQVQYFLSLVEEEITRNRSILAPAALAEFEEARRIYRALLDRAE